jgi:hypothetical protein
MTLLRQLGDKMLAALVPATEAKASQYYGCWRQYPSQPSGPDAKYCCRVYGTGSVYCGLTASQIYG